MIFLSGTTRSEPTAASRSRRAGFTLVELLVTIAIIAILASMLLGASSLAMNTARVSRTEGLVTRLHTLLSQHYDSFRHRRVEVNTADTNGNGVADYIDNLQASGTNLSGLDAGHILALGRLAATREQLKLELPDRWSDILGQSLGSTAPVASDASRPKFLAELPPMTRMFLRRYDTARKVTSDPDMLRENQGAECLYLIVMLACGDGESAGLFKETDVGDTDGDGAPEFIDAWGNPIEFLRWAPGFESDVQVNYPTLARLHRVSEEANAGSGQASVMEYVLANPDPFDLFRVDRMPNTPTFEPDSGQPARGFRILPLIYSAGPDQEPGVWAAPEWANLTSDPYVAITEPSTSDDQYLGAVVDRSTATDNIHNHLITGR